MWGELLTINKKALYCTTVILWQVSHHVSRFSRQTRLSKSQSNNTASSYASAYITFVERQRCDCLRWRRDCDALHQAGLAVCSDGGRRRPSQNHVLVYDALERAQEHHVHDAPNGADRRLHSINHDVIEPTPIHRAAVYSGEWTYNTVYKHVTYT